MHLNINFSRIGKKVVFHFPCNRQIACMHYVQTHHSHHTLTHTHGMHMLVLLCYSHFSITEGGNLAPALNSHSAHSWINCIGVLGESQCLCAIQMKSTNLFSNQGISQRLQRCHNELHATQRCRKGTSLGVSQAIWCTDGKFISNEKWCKH